MISFNNISLLFSDKIILDNVSLNIERNITSVIVGPSGAGKSSILKIILALWKPDYGEVLIDGININKITEEELTRIRKNIGIVFQNNALFDSLTVAENILYFLPNRKKLADVELQHKVEELLSFVNLGGTEDLFPEELSGGMKKRVAIARSLAFNPKVILFDEPTTGLDPINAESILELISKLKRNGTTSILVTHILNDAIAIGDKLIVINNGRIVESGTVDEILHSSNPFVQKFFNQVNKETYLSDSYTNQYGFVNVK